MAILKEGLKAPPFSLPCTGEKTISLKDYAGKTAILYFYPKDDTPGCTKESCDFNAALPNFKKLKTAVIGISRDNIASHEKFIKKYKLSFPLASDEDGKVCEKYGVWVKKSMYGRKYMGIERSTFLIGPDGKILRIWNKVKVPGHVDEVMAALKKA